MKFLLIIFTIAELAVLSVGNADEFFSYSASPIVSTEGVTGSWIIGDHELRVFGNDEGNIFSVSVVGVVSYTLREHSFISQIAVAPDENHIVLEVSRWRIEGAGSYYESLLYLSLEPGGQAISFVECMSAGYVDKFYNGRTVIRAIGSVAEFPIIELEVGKATSRNLPTDIVYVWESWDLKRRLPVSSDVGHLQHPKARTTSVKRN
jgi:hypothetical protein